MITHPYTYELLVADRRRQLQADSRRWSLARLAQRRHRDRRDAVVTAEAERSLRVVRATTPQILPTLRPSGCAGRAA